MPGTLLGGTRSLGGAAGRVGDGVGTKGGGPVVDGGSGLRPARGAVGSAQKATGSGQISHPCQPSMVMHWPCLEKVPAPNSTCIMSAGLQNTTRRSSGRLCRLCRAGS